jgi:RNA polymerase sigma factor (sigma-70 family)
MDNSYKEENGQLSKYLSRINQFPLITAKREQELGNILKNYPQNHSLYKQAFDEIISAHLRLVVRIAKKFHNNFTTLFDLIQSGNLGLVEALNRYNPNSGVRYHLYASFWVKKEIREELIRSYPICSTVRREEKKRKINNTTELLTEYYNKKPSLNDICAAIHLSGYEYGMLFANTISLSEEDLEKSPFEHFSFNENSNTLEKLIKDETLHLLREAIKTLPYKERFSIEYRYGLNNKPNLRLHKIASKLNVSLETVRNLEKYGIKKLLRNLA